MRHAPRRRSSRSSRDVVQPTPGIDVAEPRTLARYRREVVALLAAGHGIRPQQGLGLVKRWDRYVRAKWRMGRPPCNVADHLSKFHRVLRPSERDATRRKRARHPAESRHRVTMSRSVFARRMTRVGSSQSRRHSRDAEDPRKGEIYETRAGNRWEVVATSDRLVTVKRAGSRNDGPFAWGRSSLKGMKEVKKPLFGSLFSSTPAAPPPAGPAQLSLFSRGVNNDPGRRGQVVRDPSRKRSKGKKTTSSRSHKKAPPRRASAKASGAHCSNQPVLARKARTKAPPHTCIKSSKVQSLVFERYCWTPAQARSWATRHGYKTTKEDVSARYIRFRQLDPKAYKPVGSMPFMRGLTAVLGCAGIHRVKKRKKS